MTDETTNAPAESVPVTEDLQAEATDAVSAVDGAVETAEAAVETLTDVPEAALAEAIEEATSVVEETVVAAVETAAEVVLSEEPAGAGELASTIEEVVEEVVEEITAPVEAATEESAAPLEAAEEAAPEAKPKRERVGDADGIVVTDPTAALRNLPELAGDLSAEDFAAAIDQTVVELREGSIVTGTVVRIDPDEVLVDIGYKSEGVIPVKELSIRNSVNPRDVVDVGDRIEALVMQMEDAEGRLMLSKKRAQYERAWGRIEQIMEQGGTVTGHVIEVVKGGLILDIGLRGFLPASLVELRRVRDLAPYVGQPIEAKVIELDKNRNNVVLSRRAYLEEEQAEQRQAFLDALAQGEVREGVVSSVVNFGAFVDLGGMDGLVHVSELSWHHVSHPSEVVTVGDEVTVKVLEVDRDRERISLSIRQTSADPWESFSTAHEVGAVVDGKVTKTVPFGAFVSVTEGVEGLVHVSEIAMHHVESPEMELVLGQPVKVKITEIDNDRRRISLSIKQASPEWEERSQWQDDRGAKPGGGAGAPAGGGGRKPPRRREFEREEDREEEPAFNADASLEAILAELKERGIGRK
ncbi:30S ribosomal protein S1 [bacterium]|nr:30S ribosomal protein S1 [bacterium]